MLMKMQQEYSKMVRERARTTRNYKFTTRRKAGFVIGGESVKYDDNRIKVKM